MFILSATLVVTLIPWIFFGGHQGCSEFDVTMQTAWGLSFEDFWFQFTIRAVLSWTLAPIVVFMLLADHFASPYVRESIRCVLYMYLAQLLKTLGTAFDACHGTDLDGDNVRDMAYERDQLAGFASAYGTGAAFLSDIWCLQLVVERLRALEETYGQPLPCSRSILWMSRLNIWMFFALAAMNFTPPIASWVVSILSTFSIGLITLLIWRAYAVPLHVLQAALRLEAVDGVLLQLHKEAKFAMRVIRKAQIALVLASFSMGWHIASWGVSWVIIAQWTNDAFQYGAMVDTMGNTVCLLLLVNSSLHLPRCIPTCYAAQSAVDSELTEELGCTCGKKVGLPRRSQLDGEANDVVSCDKCAWAEKVAEIADRRVAVGQLLDFHKRLGSENLMPHFDPLRSTTNDVVRHAIIPESRCGNLGKALAEVLPRRSTGTPRMVTHHWQNRFSDLLAVVVADSLGMKRWDSIAQQLSTKQEEALKDRLSWHVQA